MIFKTKEYQKSYTNARKKYKSTHDWEVDPPNIIDVILEPLRPLIFKENGKINLWWLLWNVAKVVGALKAAYDEREQQRKAIN